MKNLKTKFLNILIVLLIFSNCKENEKIEVDPAEPEKTRHLTECLKNRLEKDTGVVRVEMILRQPIGGDFHYWVKTDWEDENEFIFNNICDTVCYKPGWGVWSDIYGLDESCKELYLNEEWIVVWKK